MEYKSMLQLTRSRNQEGSYRCRCRLLLCALGRAPCVPETFPCAQAFDIRISPNIEVIFQMDSPYTQTKILDV